MTTALDHRAVTTPNRFRLPSEIVAELERLAVSEGVTTDELAARLLVDVLPAMVAERTERWLRATLSLAYAVDVPAIPKTGPDDGTVIDVDAETPSAFAKGATTTSRHSKVIVSVPAGPGRVAGTSDGAV